MKIARVLAVPHVVDGDTVWAQLEYSVGETLNGRELIERDYAGGSKCRITRKDITLDTPEKKEAGWSEAKADLADWCNNALVMGPVITEIIGEDSFGRWLSDLIAADGSSLTRYMRSRNWLGWT